MGLFPDEWELYQEFKRLFEGDPPVPSSEYRALFIRSGRSGLPRDVFVNTLYFLADADKDVGPSDINDALQDFWEGTSGQTHNISYYISQFCLPNVMTKVYKMSDAKPREPIIFEHEDTTSHATGALPEEVAVCLSFSGASPLTARRRGRIFIGPLNPTAMDTEGGTVKSIVKGTLQVDLSVAAKRLANQTAAGWLVHSSMSGGSYAAVETGWIDDALDIQRRRGPEATSRYTWAKV